MKVNVSQLTGAPKVVEAEVSGVWALHDCTVTHVPTGARACWGAQTGRVAAEDFFRELAAAWPDFGAGAAFGEQDPTRVDPRVADFQEWRKAAAKRLGVAL